jgi:hypothetical protein
MFRILASIDTHVSLTQDAIKQIASSNVPYSSKDSIIQTALRRYFKSDNSTIQVTSLNSTTPQSFDISTYLYHLAGLSQTQYHDVTLTYFKELEKLASVDKVDNNSFTFNIETWQKFTGCQDKCYVDVTKKVFHATLIKQANSNYRIKIDKISAVDTYSYDDFQDRYKTLTR